MEKFASGNCNILKHFYLHFRLMHGWINKTFRLRIRQDYFSFFITPRLPCKCALSWNKNVREVSQKRGINFKRICEQNSLSEEADEILGEIFNKIFILNLVRFLGLFLVQWKMTKFFLKRFSNYKTFTWNHEVKLRPAMLWIRTYDHKSAWDFTSLSKF